MSTAAERAESFRSLHHGARPLVLPNAWDVASARVFEEAGFPAIATSSAGVMVSLGYPDGEAMPRRDLVAAVGRMAAKLAVPLSADIVSGYGTTPRAVASTVRAVVDAGAVGVNIEDHDHRRDRLFPIPAQVAKLRAAQDAGLAAGVKLVVNARTDALRVGTGDDARRFDEAVERARAYRDAGADCVYPMGLTEGEGIERFVKALDCPVNVMVRRGLPSVDELTRLGVKRISFGPAASYAAMGFLARAASEVREKGTFHALVDGAISYDELNRLATPAVPKVTPSS